MTRLEKANIRRAFAVLLRDARVQRDLAEDTKDKVLFASAQGFLNGIDVSLVAMEQVMKLEDK